jgi:hypothetical protein
MGNGHRFLYAAAIVLAAALSGCSSGNATKVVNYPVPTIVVLSPGTSASIDVGATLTFTAQAQNSAKAVLTQPITYSSNNPAVVTIAANGIACAGTWDSITSPQVCTPGPVGVAQVTASAQGVNSPPTTLYVHQHIDSVVVSPLPSQTNPPAPCVSKGQTFEYAATAMSRGSDITASVGQFRWTTTNSPVVNLDNMPVGLFQNQVQATAMTPGVSSTFASVGGVNSVPFNFVTCPVQSIALSLNGASGNQVTLASGSTQRIDTVITDSLNNVITGVPLTWSSSNPISVTVAAAATTDVGTASAVSAGGASVIASCTPPTCNIGFQPSLPIYPQASLGIVVTATSTSAAASGTLYVSSSGCGAMAGCTTTLVPVAFPANTLGTAFALPTTPNSFLFSRDGVTGYLGTDLGEFGAKGLMKLAASASNPTVTTTTAVIGKVVSISPDGTKAIVSDLADPNSIPQIFIYDAASSTATTIQVATGTSNIAADFSPDSLKAFIVASTGTGATLYVYSKVDALQTIPLTAGAGDVAFLPSGNFGYIADSSLPQLTIAPTCDNPPASTPPLITNTPATAPARVIRPLVDGRILALEPGGLELFTPTVIGTGCAFSRPYPIMGSPNPGNLFIAGNLSISNSAAFFNLGQGSFIPRQLIVSGDSSTAYVLASDANNNPLGVILTFDIPNQTASAIGLAGNAIPLQASLTPDGTGLYVGASDGAVHVVNTGTATDIQQIPFPLGLCRNAAGAPFGTTCNPDILAVRP